MGTASPLSPGNVWRRTASNPVGRAALVAATTVFVVGCLPGNSRGSAPPAGASSPGATADASASIAAARPTPPFVRPTPTPAPTFAVYTVKAGDNLNSIARKFGTTARSIAYWNGATYPSLDPESAQYQPGLVKVGWMLRIIPNVTFDEQTLPEPSDLIDTTPTESAPDSSASPDASAGY